MMNTMPMCEGVLKMDIGSEGNFIAAGQYVKVGLNSDEVAGIYFEVTSVNTDVMVRLNYFDTELNALVG